MNGCVCVVTMRPGLKVSEDGFSTLFPSLCTSYSSSPPRKYLENLCHCCRGGSAAAAPPLALLPSIKVITLRPSKSCRISQRNDLRKIQEIQRHTKQGGEKRSQSTCRVYSATDHTHKISLPLKTLKVFHCCNEDDEGVVLVGRLLKEEGFLRHMPRRSFPLMIHTQSPRLTNSPSLPLPEY